MTSKIQVEDVISSIVRKNLEDVSIEITSNTQFDELGMDSLKTLMIISDIEKELQLDSKVSLDSSMIYNYPTIEKLAQFLVATGGITK